MALKVSSVDVWAGDLRDVPGGLADVLDQVAAGGGSIDFLIARRSDKLPGTGKVFLTPVKAERTKEAAGRAGLQNATGMATLRIEGADAKGLGAKIARAIADAGINIRGVSAAVLGGKFVAYIGLDSEADAATAAAALRNVKAAPAASGKRSSGSKRPAKRGKTRGKSRR
jgi:predicted amino acid-binding ACT domain protein